MTPEEDLKAAMTAGKIIRELDAMSNNEMRQYAISLITTSICRHCGDPELGSDCLCSKDE